MEPVIVVHGGAGDIPPEEIKKMREGIKRAVREGYEILKKGKNAIDAVVEAVKILEDNPLFNAGLGSSLGIDGNAEMDAAVMLDDLSFGAVAAIKRVRNPILVARKVMEETDHVLLVGEGAEKFARLMGFSDFDPVTKERRKMLIHTKPKYYKKVEKFKKLYKVGTVGAVAIDSNGKMAAATSTGGMMFHLPGRVGDTPLPGCGTYASPLGACSVTGYGELIIKHMVAKEAVERLSTSDASEVCNKLVKELKKKKCLCGLILVDKRGNFGAAYNTKNMCWAAIKANKLFS